MSHISLAARNLVRRPYRSLCMALLVAALSFVLFGGSLLVESLQNGLGSVGARMGADMAAVPDGYDSGLENILLKGEAGYFYMPLGNVEKISGVGGVARVSPQYYLCSVNSECCSEGAVEIIGFDPATDFTITPWIKETFPGKLEDGAVLAGSNIDIANGSTLRFFGVELPVAAKLAPTGTGMDNAVFTNLSTIRSLMRAANAQGFRFMAENGSPDSVVSAVMIDIAQGYDAAEVRKSIFREVHDVRLVSSKAMVSGVTEHIRGFAGLMHVFTAIFFAMGLLMLSVIFSMMSNERKKEFAILRVIGFTKREVALLVLKEAALTSAVGGAIGAALAALVVFPFDTALSQSFGLPYLSPGVGDVLKILAASLAIALAVGPVSASRAAWAAGHTQAGLLLREED